MKALWREREREENKRSDVGERENYKKEREHKREEGEEE